MNLHSMWEFNPAVVQSGSSSRWSFSEVYALLPTVASMEFWNGFHQTMSQTHEVGVDWVGFTVRYMDGTWWMSIAYNAWLHIHMQCHTSLSIHADIHSFLYIHIIYIHLHLSACISSTVHTLSHVICMRIRITHISLYTYTSNIVHTHTYIYTYTYRIACCHILNRHRIIYVCHGGRRQSTYCMSHTYTSCTHITSYHITSCHIISHHITSCHVMSNI